MTVLHLTKVSTLYLHVVISSLAKRLEKPPFYHSYTSFGVWPIDHYMSLQRFNMGCMPGLAKVVCGTIAMLRFPEVVHGTTAPVAPCEPRWVTTLIYHSSQRGTIPTTSLISKQAISYQTHDDTYCLWVSTPATRSLAVLSMTNCITWRIPTVSTIPTHAKTIVSILTTVTSHHDRWKINTLNTQHRPSSTT
jgi:hypothetical protein